MLGCCSTESCVFLKGSFFIADYIDPCGGLAPLGCPPPKPIYKPIGNVIQAEITIDSNVFGTENKHHTKYKNCSRHQIANVSLDMTLSCASVENLKKALLGEVAIGDSGSYSEQNYRVCDGALKECDVFMLDKYNITTGTLVVKAIDNQGGDIQILVEGTDYVYEKRTIRMLKDLTILGMDKLIFEYDYDDTEVQTLDALKTEPTVKTLMFRGTNYADEEGAFFDVQVFKFRHDPVSSLDLISQDSFLILRLQGVVERFYDGNDKDCYFKIVKGAL